MPKEKRGREPEGRIYIDTCVLQGAISRRNNEDTIFMNKVKEKGWRVYTSIHTLMELFDVARDRSFLMKSVINKWVDVNTFLRERRRMNLNSTDLDEIAIELNNFLLNNSFIEFNDINAEAWKDVKEIVEKSNLHSSDALHLALARVWGCNILATHDSFFIEEGNRVLEEGNQSEELRVCDVGQIERTLEDMEETRLSRLIDT
jgi:predicted nucleic acid-binding protein